MSDITFCELPDQFDAVIHIDQTQAVQQLGWHVEAHPEAVLKTFLSAVQRIIPTPFSG